MAAAANELKQTVGVVEHGLFVHSETSVLLVSTPTGVSAVTSPRRPVLSRKDVSLAVGVGVATLALIALCRR